MGQTTLAIQEITVPSRSVLLASQPIFDRQGSVYAVELLYRNDLHQSAMDVGDTRATSELIFNLCTGITEQTEHYHSPAFINVSGDFLLSQGFLPIDPERVVIELVERMEPTDELVATVRQWHQKGFRFALDDFEFTDAWEPLLEFASVIKVDVSTITPEQVASHQARLAWLDCLWLAERVEDEATKNTYQNMGFELFQGYFYARPAMVLGEKLNPASFQLARLLGALFQEDPDIDELVSLISADPNLALSLLKIVNSPLYKASSEITSVREVVLRLGLRNLRRWIALLGTVNASSPVAARIILTRAQACFELASRSRGKAIDPDQAFLVGLLSGVDVLLGIRKSAFLAKLQMPDAVQHALNSHEGALGRNLKVVLNLEQAVQMKHDLDRVDNRLLRLYQQAGTTVQQLLSGA